MVGRVEQRQPPVAQLAGHGDVLGPFGGEVDGDVGPQRVNAGLQRLAQPRSVRQRQRVVGPFARDRPTARPDVAQDRDVLAHPRQRLGERLAVPALHHLGPGHAEPQDETATAQVIERHRRHRRRCGGPGGDLDDRGAELDVRRGCAPPCQRHQRVRAVGLGRPHRVKAQPVGLLDGLSGAGRGAPGPVAEAKAESQVTGHGRTLSVAVRCGPATQCRLETGEWPGGPRRLRLAACPFLAGRQAPCLARPQHARRVSVSAAGGVSLGNDEHVLAERR